MLSNKPLLSNNGEVKPVYNSSDFTFFNGYVTLKALLDYANLYTSNIFRSENYFTRGIVVLDYINNVSEATFDYLKNVSSDIQQQFESIKYLLTNISYYSYNNSTEIIGNLLSNFTIFNTIGSNKINTNIFKTNLITANQITTTTLKTNKLICSNIPMIYFYNQNVIYPILKSNTLGKLTGLDNTQPLYITIAPGYQVILYNVNKIPLVTVKNTTDDFIYYIPVDITNIISFEIFIL